MSQALISETLSTAATDTAVTSMGLWTHQPICMPGVERILFALLSPKPREVFLRVQEPWSTFRFSAELTRKCHEPHSQLTTPHGP